MINRDIYQALQECINVCFSIKAIKDYLLSSLLSSQRETPISKAGLFINFHFLQRINGGLTTIQIQQVNKRLLIYKNILGKTQMFMIMHLYYPYRVITEPSKKYCEINLHFFGYYHYLLIYLIFTYRTYIFHPKKR